MESVSQISKQNPSKPDVVVSVTTESSSSQTKFYKCDYCLKVLATRQSKWRHQQTCGKKSKIEKRLDRLEKLEVSSKLNLDLDSVIKQMNLCIHNFKLINNILTLMYWDNKVKKLNNDLIKMIVNNVQSYRIMSQTKNIFDDSVKKQINFNLNIINNLESDTEYITYGCDKQYLFRNNVNSLKFIATENKPIYSNSSSVYTNYSSSDYNKPKFYSNYDNESIKQYDNESIKQYDDESIKQYDTDSSYSSSDSEFDI